MAAVLSGHNTKDQLGCVTVGGHNTRDDSGCVGCSQHQGSWWLWPSKTDKQMALQYREGRGDDGRI